MEPQAGVPIPTPPFVHGAFFGWRVLIAAAVGTSGRSLAGEAGLLEFRIRAAPGLGRYNRVL